MGVLQLENIVERRRGLKRIERHSDQELNAAVAKAVDRFGDDFWLLLHGIDAYMERRKRRQVKRKNRCLDKLLSDAVNFNNWGQGQ